MSGTEILLALSIGISAIGQLAAGASANRAAEFNTRVARDNAAASRAAAAESARRQKRLGLKRQGTLRSLDPNKLDLLEDSAMEEELAVQTILHEGEVQAIGFERTAALERARGSAARTGAFVGAAATLIGGGAQIAGAGGFGSSLSFSSTPSFKRPPTAGL